MEYSKYTNIGGDIISWKDDILEVICISQVHYFTYKNHKHWWMQQLYQIVHYVWFFFYFLKKYKYKWFKIVAATCVLLHDL